MKIVAHLLLITFTLNLTAPPVWAQSVSDTPSGNPRYDYANGRPNHPQNAFMTYDPNLYAYLGIRSDAGEAEIERGYKTKRSELTRQIEAGTEDAKARLLQVELAYELLKDPVTRHYYSRAQGDARLLRRDLRDFAQNNMSMSPEEARDFANKSIADQKGTWYSRPIELFNATPSMLSISDRPGPGYFDSQVPAMEKIAKTFRDAKKMAPQLARETLSHTFSVGNAGFMIGMALEMRAKCYLTGDAALCRVINDTLSDLGGWINIGAFSTFSAWGGMVLSRVFSPNSPVNRYGGMIIGSMGSHFVGKFWASADRLEAYLNIKEWVATLDQKKNTILALNKLKSESLTLSKQASRRDLPSAERAQLSVQIQAKEREIQRARSQLDEAENNLYKFRDQMWSHATAALRAMSIMAPGELWETFVLHNISMVLTLSILHFFEKHFTNVFTVPVKNAGVQAAAIEVAKSQGLTLRQAVEMGKNSMTPYNAGAVRAQVARNIRVAIVRELKKPGVLRSVIGKSYLNVMKVTPPWIIMLMSSIWSAMKFLGLNDIMTGKVMDFSHASPLYGHLSKSASKMAETAYKFIQSPKDDGEAFTEFLKSGDELKHQWEEYREKVILRSFNEHYFNWNAVMSEREMEFQKKEKYFNWLARVGVSEKTRRGETQDEEFVKNTESTRRASEQRVKARSFDDLLKVEAELAWHVDPQYQTEFTAEFDKRVREFEERAKELESKEEFKQAIRAGVSLRSEDPEIRQTLVEKVLEYELYDVEGAQMLELRSLQQALKQSVDDVYFKAQPPLHLKPLRGFHPYNLYSSYDTEYSYLKRVFRPVLDRLDLSKLPEDSLAHEIIVQIKKEMPLGQDTTAEEIVKIVNALGSKKIYFQLANQENGLTPYTQEQKIAIIALMMARSLYAPAQNARHLWVRKNLLISTSQGPSGTQYIDPYAASDIWGRLMNDIRSVEAPQNGSSDKTSK